jgi:hypothetical protein
MTEEADTVIRVRLALQTDVIAVVSIDASDALEGLPLVFEFDPQSVSCPRGPRPVLSQVIVVRLGARRPAGRA